MIYFQDSKAGFDFLAELTRLHCPSPVFIKQTEDTYQYMTKYAHGSVRHYRSFHEIKDEKVEKYFCI